MKPGAAVSILIPCHNAAPYLAATLSSALAQTLTAIEVIVVDDRSTDASRQIAERFSPAVKVVSAEGTGASAARNQASAISSGAFLQYLDADDLLEPHALSSRVEALHRTGADFAISDWQRVVGGGGAWRDGRVERSTPPAGMPLDVAVLRGYWAPPAAILYRRTIWERTEGWRDTLPVIQDARFLLDAARIGGRVTTVPGVGARYRQHTDQSLSSSSPVKFWRDVLRNALEVERLWWQDGGLDPMRRGALAEVLSNCVLQGLSLDRALFYEAAAELRRFGAPIPSKRVRAALMAARLVGYGPTRALLSAKAAGSAR